MAAADRFDIVLRGRGGHAAQPHHTPDASWPRASSWRSCTPSFRAASTRANRRCCRSPASRAATATTCCRRRCGSPAPCAASTLRRRTASRPRCARPSTAWRWPAAPRRKCTTCATTLPPSTRRRSALALAAAAAIGLQAERGAARRRSRRKTLPSCSSERPGAYLWLGQGRADPGPDGEHALHHPCYDFNDDALPLGVRWFCEVAERALAPVPIASLPFPAS